MHEPLLWQPVIAQTRSYDKPPPDRQERHTKSVSDSFIPVGAPIHTRRLSRLETALAARRNVLELIPALSYNQGIVSGEMLMRWHMLADPACYKRVMLDNLSNYPKSEIMRRMLRPAIGESLFNADGADWKWQRQAVTPVFTTRNVTALSPAMSATTAIRRRMPSGIVVLGDNFIKTPAKELARTM